VDPAGLPARTRVVGGPAGLVAGMKADRVNVTAVVLFCFVLAVLLSLVLR